MMGLQFSGEIWEWRGPAPFYFVTVPEEQSQAIKSAERLLTYGWGMIPVKVRIGKTEWRTSLWPKDGRYVLPLKDQVRQAERLEVGQTITAKLEVSPERNRKR
ncbi:MULTISPECIES: DUF1905 domain-containing protein [Meiothermus]|uniref:DUF1905 domain-containing protein n=2 Tax=Meiothermus hypogaeus TaxID=884155 RepID=A0A511R6M2_9DEIN|nr:MULTISPECIES: DUF1905 domain-containing protein [Meiothermus]RIH74554.1 hypothetical protein Mhypo_03295 [Meiothermus hypogaeus]GEM84656.1 hypothetical protein MHY01S_28220 [Meiothermus hypogaeus NBRC 106114]GIW35803.1 MAG: hypothetical protein KatS3mg072_3136 [Meiothermus sp.]